VYQKSVYRVGVYTRKSRRESGRRIQAQLSMWSMRVRQKPLLRAFRARPGSVYRVGVYARKGRRESGRRIQARHCASLLRICCVLFLSIFSFAIPVRYFIVNKSIHSLHRIHRSNLGHRNLAKRAKKCEKGDPCSACSKRVYTRRRRGQHERRRRREA